MAQYPDGCHLVFGIFGIFIGIGLIMRGVNEGTELGLGIVVTVFAISYSACMLNSIIKKYRFNSF